MRRKTGLLAIAALFLPCALHGQTWTQQTPAASPTARDSAAMVYDPVRHQMVLFGGQDFGGVSLNDTWVYDGANWQLMNPVHKPPARVFHAMAFDAAHGVVLLFGGQDTAGPSPTLFNDTWTWNGTDWTQKSAAVVPSARQAPAMAYYPSSGHVYLFGGKDSSGVLHDTWYWDGVTWTSQSTSAVPGRRFAAMAADTVHNVLVMFGGDNPPNGLGDTWIWDGSNWTQRNPAHSPSARDSQMAFDPVRGLTVLFGGSGLNDTWTWNGTDWTQESTSASPPARFYVNMDYDTERSKMVLFGGLKADFSSELNDTWTLGYNYTSGWMNLTASQSGGPSARYNAAAADDYNETIVFGGTDGTTVFADTWYWGGHQWGTVGNGPPARQSAAMVNDPGHNVMLMFGGDGSLNGSNLLADTWSYNLGWTSHSPAHSPSARFGHAMAYDAQHSNTVLFGGKAAAALNDTWTWNGTDWTQMAPANSPPARSYAAMVYDTARQQVVMFGGVNGSTYRNDTWVWDGTNWTQKTPATSPPVRANFAMVYDSVHGFVELFGGLNSGGALNDTWIWDGTTWTQVTVPVSTLIGPPSPRSGMAYTYIPPAGQFFVFGGQLNSGTRYFDVFGFGSPYVRTTLPVGYNGRSYNYTIVPNGGVGPYKFTEIGSPSKFESFGLTFDTNTGIIGGTDVVSPGQPPLGVGVTVTDAQGQSVDVLFALLTDAAISFSPIIPKDATAGTTYTTTLSATGGTPGYTYSATGLPAGITISGATISGQCTASSSNVMVSVLDSIGGSVSAGPYTINCNPAPQITTTSLPDGDTSHFYSVQLQTNAVYDAPGAAPYTWSIDSGQMPSGLNFLSDGSISGTPSNTGTTPFTIRFTDAWGATTTKSFSIKIIQELNISNGQLPLGNLTMPYPPTPIIPVGGYPGYTYGVTGLPPGLNFDTGTGQITGTPTAAGTFNAVFTVTDQLPEHVIKSIPITVGNPGTYSIDWAPGQPETIPGGRNSAAMFYDSVRNNTVLFGGYYNGEPGVYGDTYTWDGGDWTQRTPANAPSERGAMAAAFDTGNGVGVLFGGLDAEGLQQNDTWTWNGTTWTKLIASGTAGSPSQRSGALMAYDGHQIVLFGGNDGSADLHDTWIWNGSSWTQVNVPGPSARIGAAMGYDPVHGKVVLFGGYEAGSDFAETWLWDGASKTWTQVHPSPTPDPRDSASMAFDTSRGRLIMFGGIEALYDQVLNDTWAWDGTNWSAVTTVHAPPARSSHMMAFDASHTHVVLFGGADSSFLNLNDTWEITGNIVTSSTTLPAATQGTPYSSNLLLRGGLPPIVSSPLTAQFPPGITFDAAALKFVGTPTAAGDYTFTVDIEDAAGTSIAPSFTLHVASPASTLVLSNATLPDATVATNYLVQLAATGGTPPYIFGATGLPSGLSRNSGDQIVGQCTAGSTNVMLSVLDSASSPQSASVGPLTVKCNAVPALTTTSPLTSGVVNAAYTATFQMTGGTAPITWTLTPGNLPGGFNLSQSGVLTGTATAPVTANFTVAVSDLWGAIASTPYQLKIYPVLSMTTTSLPGGTAGVAYTGGTIAASGGTGTGTYVFSATGLPTGLSVDPATGVISGTTVQSGTFTPTFTIKDGDAQVVNKQLNLAIAAGSGVIITSPKLLSTGTIGQPYSYQIQWTGGVSPYQVTGSGLPAWLQLDASTGKLTGTPPAGGAFNFSLTVTDAQTPTANTATKAFTIVVSPPTLATATPLPAAVIGIAYSKTLTANGGTPPVVFTSSNLPSWLSMTTLGGLTGTPPVGAPASVSFDVTLTDTLGAFSTSNVVLPIQAPPPITFTTTSPLPAATANAPYTATFLASGGDGVFTFSATGLPGWLSFDPATAILSGTPPSAGPVTFSITVADDVNQSLTQSFTLPVNTALTIGTTSPLSPATVGVLYSKTLSASGGSGSFAWSATGLPSWLTVSTAGVVSGTPTTSGTVPFTLILKDALNPSNSVSLPFQLPVDAALTINTTSPLSAATSGFPYTVTFGASGGSGTYHWSATGLPSGFNLTTAGVLTGTPSSANPITFDVTLADTLSNSLTQSFTLPVNATVTINNSSPLPAAVQLSAYTANFTASGGAPGYTWTATGLPSWLTLTTAGYLSGTPPTGGTQVTFQVTATDSQSHAVTLPFTLPVNTSLSIGTSTLPLATAGVAYSTTLTASGGLGSYTWSATGLPSGLTMSPAGLLSGATTLTGIYPVVAKVADSSNAVTKPLTLYVTSALPLSFVTQSLGSCNVGASCTSQIVAAGGLPPYVFSLAPNADLNGLTFSATGLVSGSPASAGQIGIPVIVTDQLYATASKTFTITAVGPLTITTTALPPATVGTIYSGQMASSGGLGPFTWSLLSGPVPPGLTFTPQGTLQGTPTASGSYPLSIQVHDSQQTSPSAQITVVVQPPPAPLSIGSAGQLPPATVGTLYSQSLQANGGSGSYHWSLAAGSPPDGLTFAANGAISGTPTTAQTATFTATVSDTAGNSATAPFTIAVTDPTHVALLAANPLPNGAVGQPYNYGINVAGGTPPYFWSITQGQVPPGLTFDATNGSLNGVPTQQGAYNLVLSVVDSSGASPSALAAEPRASAPASVTNNYTVRIAGAGDFQITTGLNLPNATRGQSYSVTLAASGGASPYKWKLVNGTLPAGLLLNPAGILTGTPTAAGAAQLLIGATDTTGALATRAFLLNILDPNVPAIVATPPPAAGIVGAGYRTVFTAVGGHSPYTWALRGSLPPGLTLDPSSGAVSGTPTLRGSYKFTLLVTDSAKVSASLDTAIRVNAMTLSVSPSVIPHGVPSVPYSFGLSADGGTAPYVWSLSAGSLLTGFSIDPVDGVISGTPSGVGDFPFTISVVDSNYNIAVQQFDFVVSSGVLTIPTNLIPAGTVGTSYAFGLQASNASPPLSFTVVSGTLPAGLSLDSATGMLFGMPSAAGIYTFTVQVQDASSATAQVAVTMVVNAPPLSIVTASLPGGAVGSAYSQTLQASNWKAPLTWTVAGGALPPGLALGGSTGVIAGTPTAVGNYAFTVLVTDGAQSTARQNLSIAISGPPPAPTITISGLPTTSSPGDQPTVTIKLSSPYSLPLLVTATLSIAPAGAGASDLMFANGSRTTQFTIPANVTQSTLAFQAGTLAGAIQLTLSLSAAGVDITPPTAPAAATTIPASAPVIRTVTATKTASGLQVSVVGISSTLDMKSATFHFTAASGSTLQNTDIAMDVSSLFAQWYQSAASQPTGSQFSLTMPFTVTGNVSTIASVSVTLTNSAGTSAAVTAAVQ